MKYFRSRNSPLYFLLLHVALGAFIEQWRFLSTYWGLLAFSWFFFRTLYTRNRSGLAHLGAAYIVGLEVLLRMSKASLFWEFGKLACTALITAALLLERGRHPRWHYLLLLLLFAPSLFLAADLSLDRYRQMITYQLGGMILLILASVYFAGRRMQVADFQKSCRYMLYPIAAMLTYLSLHTPSFQEIQFTSSSNFAASGGFGPNQVSTILGLGMLLLFLNYLLRYPPLFGNWIDKAFVGWLLFRALLTFSRGGVLAAALALVLGYLVYAYSAHLGQFRKTLFRTIVGLAVAAGLFVVTDDLTGGVLSMRYKGEKPGIRYGSNAQMLEKYSSGRLDIMLTDILMFLDHPLLGVGVGESNILRPRYGVVNNPHTEQTRLLSEHGILGLILLLWLIGIILSRSFTGPPHWRFLSVALCGLVFFTMLHAATRLAMVGFVFGLGLIHLYENHSLHRQSPLQARSVSLRSRGIGTASST